MYEQLNNDMNSYLEIYKNNIIKKYLIRELIFINLKWRLFQKEIKITSFL